MGKINRGQSLWKVAITTSAMAIFSIAGNATAADLNETAIATPDGGLYVSAKVGASTLDHSIFRLESTPGLPVADSTGVFSTDSTDVSFGGAIGYEHYLGDGQTFLGIEGFYNFENASTRNVAGVLVTDVDLEASYGARIIAGFKTADRVSIYAHGGVTWLDYEVGNSYTFAPPVTSRSDTEVGFSYGVGVGYDFSEKATAFLEYTQITDVEFDGIPEVAGGTGRINRNELDLQSISFGIKYSLN